MESGSSDMGKGLERTRKELSVVGNKRWLPGAHGCDGSGTDLASLKKKGARLEI